ncbi:MAG: dimethyl sulfoxide reductase anchor subunit family protein [Coriobacteriales bacterium]
MGSGFSEAPLALFTTLAPSGAAAFIVLFIAILMAGSELDKESLRHLDKTTTLPVAVLLAGFACTLFHVANPLGALGVFSGVGSSPLSNEVLVGALAALSAVVYWALGVAGKLGEAHSMLRRSLLALISCLAIVFAAFCGAAYMVQTIPTWNTPLSIVEMLGFALAGGAVLGAATLALAKVKMPARVWKASAGVAAAGAVLATAGLAAHMAGLGSIANIWGSAAELVPAFGGLIALFAVCGLAGAGVVFALGKRPLLAAVPCAAFLVVAVGIFMARIGFYGLYMGIAF